MNTEAPADIVQAFEVISAMSGADRVSLELCDGEWRLSTEFINGATCSSSVDTYGEDVRPLLAGLIRDGVSVASTLSLTSDAIIEATRAMRERRDELLTEAGELQQRIERSWPEVGSVDVSAVDLHAPWINRPGVQADYLLGAQ